MGVSSILCFLLAGSPRSYGSSLKVFVVTPAESVGCGLLSFLKMSNRLRSPLLDWSACITVTSFPGCRVLMCLVQFSLRDDAFVQYGHIYGFTPLCVCTRRMCFFKLDLPCESLVHRWHLYIFRFLMNGCARGRSAEACCCPSVDPSVTVEFHIVYSWSINWCFKTSSLLCVFKSSLDENLVLHLSHTKGLCFSLMCLFRLFSVLYRLLHKRQK